MRTASQTILLLSVITLAGCGDGPAVQAYETDKPSGVEPVTSEQPIEISGLVHTPPVGWHRAEPNTQILADYRVQGLARMSVSRFGGGLPQNINRWRNQLGLEQVTGLPHPSVDMSFITTPAGPITLIDMKSTEPHPTARRFRIAMFAHQGADDGGGETWFFKFDGPDYLIEEQKAAFDAMIKSMRWTRDDAPPGQDPPDDPPADQDKDGDQPEDPDAADRGEQPADKDPTGDPAGDAPKDTPTQDGDTNDG